MTTFNITIDTEDATAVRFWGYFTAIEFMADEHFDHIAYYFANGGTIEMLSHFERGIEDSYSPPRWISIPELAQKLEIKQRVIKDAIQDGRLPALPQGRLIDLYSPAVIGWIKQQGLVDNESQ